MNKSKIKIEKGKELPKIKTGRPRGATKYPWPEMEVGDRFLALVGEAKSLKVRRSSLITMARLWAIRNGLKRKFATRIIDGSLYIYRVR